MGDDDARSRDTTDITPVRSAEQWDASFAEITRADEAGRITVSRTSETGKIIVESEGRYATMTFAFSPRESFGFTRAELLAMVDEGIAQLSTILETDEPDAQVWYARHHRADVELKRRQLQSLRDRIAALLPPESASPPP